jgi:putative oxidoreductase
MEKVMDAGLLLARMVLGLLMAAHGAQKLFGWFGGYGLAGTGGFFESLGFRPGKLFAAAAGATEIAGGLLLALGLLGPLGPALIISVMIVAIVTVHWAHGVFSQNNGIELPLLYSVTAAAIALIGHGAYSVDALLQLTWGTDVVLAALALGVLGGLGNLAIRKAGPTEAHV